MIQEELWIAQLASFSNTDVSTSNELWTSFCRLMGQFLSKGESVWQDGIGLWQTVKTDEYIAIQSDGSRLLIPPRIDLVLTKPVSYTGRESVPQALTDLVPYTEEVILRWWKSIPDLLMELLKKGHRVSWMQFGRFEPEKVGDDLVGFRFFPEGELSDLLNRPFSMFPSVSLQEETTLPDTDVRTADESAGSFISFLQESEVEAPISEVEKNDSDEEIVPEQKEDIPIPDKTEEEQGEAEEVLDPPLAPEEHTPQEEAPSKDIEQKEAVANPLKTRTIIWVFLAFLLIGSAAYFFFHLWPKLSSESSVMEEPKEVVAPIRIDTVKKEEIDSSKLVPAPTDLGHITIKKGDILARIAQEKYGDRVFWVYIYEENKDKIKNPNNVPLGTELVLPLPEKYAINSADTASLKRALALQFQIGMKYK